MTSAIMLTYPTLVSFWISLQPIIVRGASEKELLKNTTTAIGMLDNILNKINDKVRPNVYGKPLRVKCDFSIQSISSIDEVDMEFKVDVLFRQRWIDERLTFTNQTRPVIVPAKYVDNFWVPDIFFPNERSAFLHNVVVPNKVIKVFPDGLVRYSTRLSLRLACPMGLLHFPLDYQNCEIKISSYTYDRYDVILMWLQNPIEINVKDLSLPQFEYLGHTPGYCKEEYSTGQFSCLKVVFRFKRLMGYYYLQTYIPSVLIVIISWISFWISKEAVPARITLGVTTVLTMTTQLSSSRSTQMKVSYPKAIDVWYAFCMILVFSALVEYALVNVLTRAKKKLVKETEQIIEDASPDTRQPLAGDSVVEIDEPAGANSPRGHETRTSFQNRLAHQMYIVRNRVFVPVESYAQTCCGKLTPEGVDKCSRIIFPAAFILFNISYWIVYSQPVVFFSHVFV